LEPWTRIGGTLWELLALDIYVYVYMCMYLRMWTKLNLYNNIVNIIISILWNWISYESTSPSPSSSSLWKETYKVITKFNIRVLHHFCNGRIDSETICYQKLKQ
jgi:hypothetical protein